MPSRLESTHTNLKATKTIKMNNITIFYLLWVHIYGVYCAITFGDFKLDANGDLEFHVTGGSFSRGPLALKKNKEEQTFGPFVDDHGATTWLNFYFSIYSQPQPLLFKEARTIFFWDEGTGHWMAKGFNGKIWCLHFKNDGEFSFNSRDNKWFYYGKDGGIEYREFSAGDSLLHLDQIGLYAPTRNTNRYIAFSYLDDKVTGFSYSEWLEATIVDMGSDGSPILMWPDTTHFLVLHEPSTIPAASASSGGTGQDSSEHHVPKLE